MASHLLNIKDYCRKLLIRLTFIRSVFVFGARWAGLLAWVAVLTTGVVRSAEPGAPPVTILDGSGVWRALHSWNAPLLQTPAGLQERRNGGPRSEASERPGFHFMFTEPGSNWTATTFDDSSWARRHFFAKYANGELDERAGGGSASPYLRQLCLRGKFTVTDAAQAGRLWLDLSYRGGVAVHVNGVEITRQNLPPGQREAGGAAEMYPIGVYLKDNGKPWHWYNDRDQVRKAVYPLRVRRLEKVPIPANLLQKGLNVLAVEIHAAPYPEAFQKVTPDWSTCGLVELHLQAERAAGFVPNVVRPSGMQVWNTSPAEQIFDLSWADAHEPLQSVSLAGPRNGACSARILVSSDQPLKSVSAKLAGLLGPNGATLPPAAVRVGYGKFDAARASRWGGANDGGAMQWGPLARLRDDVLLESPPPEAPLSAKQMPRGTSEDRVADGLPPTLKDGALLPIWVLVETPRDAVPGQYRGTLTVSAQGRPIAETPVTLSVLNWTLPDPTAYAYWLGLIQSPEAVALTYDVPPWSERHCQLVGQSLEWIGKLSGKVLYLPLAAESQYGNAQSLVLWVQGADGKYTHDFSRVEKYVDLALKHAGRPQFVVAGVWDSCMHVSVPEEMKRNFPRISVLDPKTGKIATQDGPIHGTLESADFWRPVLTQLRDLLAQRGLADNLLIGYCADRQPDEATVGVFHDLLPDAGWQATRHPPIANDTLPYRGGAVPSRYQANVWGGWENWDPDERRVYGWKHPVKPGLRTWLDRGLFDASPVCQFRLACEQSLLADRHGLGQIGADFWPVPGPDGKTASTMVGRFPSTSEGNLGIYAGQLLYPGPDGPVASVRYQMLRENIQECEARIFLEKLLLESPSRLPPNLSAKVQAMLDERTRWHRMLMLNPAPESAISWPYSGWETRAFQLYEVAAEAAQAIRAQQEPK